VESTLKSVTSQMNYNFDAEYQLAFECPTHPGRDHLCVVESAQDAPQSMLCLYNARDVQPKEILSQHSIWFEEVNVMSMFNHRTLSTLYMHVLLAMPQ
jgi:hypothetical protein